jgi:hypothetical protein
MLDGCIFKAMLYPVLNLKNFFISNLMYKSQKSRLNRDLGSTFF